MAKRLHSPLQSKFHADRWQRALLEHNYAVFSINPKQLDRFRDRHTVAGAKDDRRDAFVAADPLRTGQHRFDACDRTIRMSFAFANSRGRERMLASTYADA